MDHILLTGIIGSLILVIGAAWPEPKPGKHPAKSVKNWLFTIGSFLMLIYAFLGYEQGGPVFFVILEILIVISTILMMFNVPDKIDAPIIAATGLGLIIWSLYLFENYTTLIFVIGLCGLSLGYAFQTSSTRRNIALILGSILIAIFSYIEASWIFFWLNIFFALFTTYHLYKTIKHDNKIKINEKK